MKLTEIKKYHANGKLREHYFLDYQNRIHGKYIEYYDDGISISFEANFKEGKYHGKYIDYYRDGSISYSGYFWHEKQVTKAEFFKLKYDEVMEWL